MLLGTPAVNAAPRGAIMRSVRSTARRRFTRLPRMQASPAWMCCPMLQVLGDVVRRQQGAPAPVPVLRIEREDQRRTRETVSRRGQVPLVFGYRGGSTDNAPSRICRPAAPISTMCLP